MVEYNFPFHSEASRFDQKPHVRWQYMEVNVNIFPLMKIFSDSPDKSLVAIECLVLCPLIGILFNYGFRSVGLGANASGAVGIVVCMLLINRYGVYLNR